MAKKDPLILDGRYRLLRPAGTGGTSNVFQAEDTHTGMLVAVKVLKQALARDAEMVQRFEREAALLASIDHPNVVHLIHFEAAPEGVILILDWVEGRRLDEELEAAPLDGPRALHLLQQLAQALAAVHAAGVVHRDLKPENVMLEEQDGQEVVRLLDFGIARFKDNPALAKGTFVTLAGKVAGTPAYMSPEQAEGQPATPATDVYTFGVLAHRALSGKLPFTGPGDFDYIEQHLRQRPPPLVPLDNALAGKAVLDVVARCLEKRPTRRPRDGLALAEALEKAISQGIRPASKSWF
jgi:serine/threonine protein kinase, bacterial